MDRLATGHPGLSSEGLWPEQLDAGSAGFNGTREERRCGAARICRASDLHAKTFDPITYVVPGYVAEGCTILAGRPKLGKSWLCLEMALAVSSGATCLGGVICTQGSVLLLALEDNERRLQRRLDKLSPTAGGRWPDSLHYATEWQRADDGGLDDICQWIENTPTAKMIIIDVLALFRPVRETRQAYEADYAAISSLQAIASKYRVAIVVGHHVRKMGADGDQFEKISGSFGLTGAADAALILDRDGQGATLYGRGRDIEEIETAVAFDKESCRWSILGNTSEFRRSEQRKDVLALLAEATEPMSPREIAGALGSTDNAMRKLLHMMAKSGEVKKIGRGRYLHPDRTDPAQSTEGR